MSITRLMSLLRGGMCATVLLATMPAAQAFTINFSDYSNTYLSSADCVTFSLAPGYAVNMFGPSPYTVPFVNAFGDPDQIANSGNDGEYPTSNTLTFTFPRLVSGLSFFFDNYGSSSPVAGTASTTRTERQAT
jgi:hypothetical protein